jgi:hypothetical protein
MAGMKFTLELAIGETVLDYGDIAAVLRNVADDVEEPSEPAEITGHAKAAFSAIHPW